jgi:hypothetical protein
MSFEDLIARPAFSIPQAEKEALLLPALNALTRHHREKCEAYRRMLDAMGAPKEAQTLAALPFLPAPVFKHMDLVSTQEKTMLLQSSGTSGQTPSRIFVDAETSARQSRALVETLRPLLGGKRLPFLVIDTRKIIADPATLSARGAGVLGLMKFGAQATFALDENLNPDLETIRSFVAKHGANPFLIFGFTFLIWSRLQESFADGALDLSNAILLHSGGWKKMEAEKITNEAFKAALLRKFGLSRVVNFYGMVEQIGSLFLEGEDGLLYPPNFADVIIRDEKSREPLGIGQSGMVQVLSALPLSYPGHNLLTGDRGEIVAVDGGAGGRLGKALRLHGRLPQAELRGCSDVVGAA